MAKHRLIFDPAITGHLDKHDIVGNIELDSSGSVITAGDGSADNVASTFNGKDVRGFLFGYDSVGGNWDRIQSTNGSLHVDIKSPLEIDVLIEAEKAEDSAHVSGAIGNFVLAIRDDGVQATATAEGATFLAVNYGVSGNSISLVFDGIDDIDTVVGAWNVANPGNQVTFSGVVGTTVLTAQTVNLLGGAKYTEFTSDSQDYSGISVDQYGRIRTRDDDVLAQLQSGVIVSATDFDIRDLNSATDSVSTLDVINTLENVSTTISNVSSAAVVASALANRKKIWIYNNSKDEMWIGKAGVTSANGMPLGPHVLLELNAGASAVIHAISDDVSSDLRVMEGA